LYYIKERKMANQRGRVIKSGQKYAHVITEKNDACGGCSSVHNCGTCMVASKVVTRVRNPIDAKEGDQIIVSLPTNILLKGAALLYLIPVAGVILGAFAGSGLASYLGLGETMLGAIFSFLGLCLGFTFLVFFSRRTSTEELFTPVISNVLATGSKGSKIDRIISTDMGCKVCAG
jgi:sigma-E factor negative regulatory protein RseC